MLKYLALAAALLGGLTSPALASNCVPYTYTLTNGTTADANQVMSNFDAILGCANNNLAASGVNSDITQLTGLTAPLTVPQGGTGLGTLPMGDLIVGAGTSAPTYFPVASAGGVLGNARDLKIAYGSTTTLTINADEVIAETALGGTAYRTTSTSLQSGVTFNSATTGANGMDTGGLPTSGFVSIYAIYNPTSASVAVLGTTSGHTSIYGGSNMPSGYTASALIGLWPTDSSAHLISGFQQGRRFVYATPVVVATGVTFPASFTALSVASAIPPSAVSVSGIIGSTSDTQTGVFAIASSSGGSDATLVSILAGGSAVPLLGFTAGGAFRGLSIQTAQTVYVMVAQGGGTNGERLSVTGFSF